MAESDGRGLHADMAAYVEFTLSYNTSHGHLRMYLHKAKLNNQHSQPFAKVHILPGRKGNSYKPLDPLSEDEVLLTVSPSDINKSTLQIIFYDVNRYVQAKKFMGYAMQLQKHECIGTVQVPLQAYNWAETQSFREHIFRCEDRGRKAYNICQLLCFEEDFKAFCTQFCKPSAVLIDFMNDRLVNPVFRHLLDNIEMSRGPVIYFVGRSGAGKSSLINALANIPVAEVSDVEATPGMFNFYSIDFDSGSSWKIYDTRGLAGTLMPDENVEDPILKVKEQLVQLKPDIILYVVSAKEVRNCLNELITLSTVIYEVQEAIGIAPPVIVVITHTDLMGNLGEWPPDLYPSKQQFLKEMLVFTATKILQPTGFLPINSAEPHYGYNINGKKYIQNLIPVALPKNCALWNIETLARVMGKLLPTEARYQFCEPQKRPYLMRDYASPYIKYFAGVAAALSAIPVPGSDTLTLTVLQVLMICVIAQLAGRELSLSSAREFMEAMGATYVLGHGLLRGGQDVIKFVPVAGTLISASISAAGTYAMGKSAQTYFFDGKKRNPSEFQTPSYSNARE